MKDSDQLDAWLQIRLPHDSTLLPMGTIWIPLQILGILKTCLCRSAVERRGTAAPGPKSYGYCEPLVEATESNDSQESI